MTKSFSRSIAIAATLVLIALAVNAPAFKSNTASADPPMTNAQLKSLYEEKCSACHDAYDPAERGYSQAQWQSTVDRMMNAHNARTSITDAQAAEIVIYLGQFAPRPGSNIGSNEIGIWQADPAQSVAYPFTYSPNLQSFDISGGSWKIVPAPDAYSGYLKAFTPSNATGMVLENKNNFQGALDLRCQFQVIKTSPTATVGLVFGATDSANYLTAQYTPSTGALTVSKVVNGTATVLQQAVIASTQLASASEWHDLRVKVSMGGQKLEVWLDYQKQLSSSSPGFSGGRVGIISNGSIIAGYRQMMIDTYQSAVQSPAGDVMLH